jgi:hypothetical protein
VESVPRQLTVQFMDVSGCVNVLQHWLDEALTIPRIAGIMLLSNPELLIFFVLRLL